LENSSTSAGLIHVHTKTLSTVEEASRLLLATLAKPNYVNIEESGSQHKSPLHTSDKPL
jgi:hypothetical protein